MSLQRRDNEDCRRLQILLYVCTVYGFEWMMHVVHKFHTLHFILHLTSFFF